MLRVGLVILLLCTRLALAAELEVHFIDVGQGDAALVKTPAGKAILIDAGNIEAGQFVDAYLEKQGVGALDLVIVSHPHLDHMGGMLEVLKKHRPKAYIDPAYAHPLENYDELLDWLEAEQVPVKTGRGGRTITVEPGITIELLAPDEPLLKGTRSDANSNSVVARIVYGAISFLFTGDSEDETEDRILESGRTLKSTVLKVAHHGGRYSTSDRWLANVQADEAVISCGKINGYGHPTKETLGRLEARNVKVHRTDLDGDVIARTDGKKLRWESTGDASAKLDEPGGVRSLNRGKETSAKRDAANDGAQMPAPTDALDLNTANEAQLEKLPGIGDSMAKAILADRAKNGAYPDLDALMRVRGIGHGLVEKLRPYLKTETKEAAPVRVAKVDPTPAPIAPIVPQTGPAPRPVAKPNAAYRVTSRTPAPAPQDEPQGLTGRLLGAPRRARVNLNLATADAIARNADIPLDEARRIVEFRTSRGLLHGMSELNAVEGLSVRSRAAVMSSCAVRIELNRASEADLIALGLDAATSRAVVETRQALGRFATPDDLEEVEALTPAAREKILPLVTVDERQAWK